MEDENENVNKDEEEEYDVPSYACDEKTKDGFIHVIVWIRGLETSSDLQFKGILPTIVKQPSNASVDVLIEDCSLCVTVIGESGDLKWQKIRLKVDKLLHEIVAEESYFEVDKERILLYLCKKEDISWYPAMENGIEAEEPEEEET